MKLFPWSTSPPVVGAELPYELPSGLGRGGNQKRLRTTKRDRAIRKLVLETCADNARRIGIDRRQFLMSAMGMTTSLWVLNYVAGCSNSSSTKKLASNLRTDGGTDSGVLDSGGFCVPRESMFDPECASSVVGDGGTNQFIFDIQTHWFNEADLANFPAYTQSLSPLFAVATEDNYINTFFCNSDVSMVALSGWPGISCTPTQQLGCGFPLSNESVYASQDKINALGGNSQRVVSHAVIMPQDPGGLVQQLELMHEYYCEHSPAAWQLYPGFKPGFKLNDASGEAVVQKGLELGLGVFSVHKGLPIGDFFDTTASYPDDIGPAASKYPAAKIIVYHSAIFAGSASASAAPPEGPFDPNDTSRQLGVNALIRSVLDAGLQPGSNVYGDTSSAYSSIMTDPTQSAHFFGKLMKYLGTDNVCWGSDALGSSIGPQQQIEAFRAFEISQSMMDQYGYPALGPSTAEGRANQDKILGLNAAKIYGVDVAAKRCQVNGCPMTLLKRQLDEELGRRRWG